LNIDSKNFSVINMVLHTADARSEVTCVYAVNVNNNKMVFSAGDHVLIKLLR